MRSLWFGLGLILVGCGAEGPQTESAEDSLAVVRPMPIAYIRERKGPTCDDLPVTHGYFMCEARHPQATIIAHTSFMDVGYGEIAARSAAESRCQGSVVSMGGWDPALCHWVDCASCE